MWQGNADVETVSCERELFLLLRRRNGFRRLFECTRILGLGTYAFYRRPSRSLEKPQGLGVVPPVLAGCARTKLVEGADYRRALELGSRCRSDVDVGSRNTDFSMIGGEQRSGLSRPVLDS